MGASKDEAVSWVKSVISETSISDEQALVLLQGLYDLGGWDRSRLLWGFAPRSEDGAARLLAAMKQVMTSWVYVITDEHGRTKVGKADSPAKRKRMLQTGSAGRLTLHAAMKCGEGRAHQVERQAHVLLAAYRVRGEWFAVEPVVATEAVKQAWAAVYTN